MSTKGMRIRFSIENILGSVYNRVMENVIENLNSIIAEIDKIKLVNGISRDIEILGASKTRDLQTLLDVAKDGRVTVFGENRVQEFMSKYTPSLTWDIIGQLQTNKVKYVIGKVRYIQSLDRIPLADEIEKQARKNNLTQKCLVEINSGAEEAKGGLYIDDVIPFIEYVNTNYEHIKICGLMAVAPKGIGDDNLRKLFGSVNDLYVELKNKYGYEVLSMGMSEDYKIAVECGSTSVRLGRVLFGERR